TCTQRILPCRSQRKAYLRGGNCTALRFGPKSTVIGTGRQAPINAARGAWSSVLDERRSVAGVFLLLFKHFLFLRRVLRFLLALLRRLMGHGSLRCDAETAASRQYRPKSGAVQVPAGASRFSRRASLARGRASA